MKKLLLIIALCFVVCSIKAQIYTFRTTEYAYKYTDSYGRWSAWSDWESSDMLVVMNLDNDIVKIYSPETQTYKITEYTRKYRDSSGGYQIEFKFIDQDYDRGTMRFRIETNGNSQIYIDFANLMWVYNVVRK